MKMSWRKSSYSQGANTECVELGDLGSSIGLRDSKNPGLGHLDLQADTFAALLGAIKSN